MTLMLMFVYLYWTAGRIVMSYTGISTTILFLIVVASVCVCVCVSVRPRSYISLSHSLTLSFLLSSSLSLCLNLSLSIFFTFFSFTPTATTSSHYSSISNLFIISPLLAVHFFFNINLFTLCNFVEYE